MPKSSSKASANGSSKVQTIICPTTGDKVFITTVTLADMKKAAKTGECPNLKSKKQLVRIPSKTERQKCLDEAARAIEAREAQALPQFGGRPWKVSVKLSETPKGQKTPLFRWFRGKLELACLPHHLEKTPDPLKQKGITAIEEEEDDTYVSKACLQERTVSSLSTVAWNDREHAVPGTTLKWMSPNHVMFYSRKTAWDHAAELMEQQTLMDKVLLGYGARGQKLKPFKPTKAQSLQVGKLRFLRDGLWVVGQEESWQSERAEELRATQKSVGSKCSNVEGTLEAAPPTEGAKETSDSTTPPEESEHGDAAPEKPQARRRISALQYYLRCQREPFRAKKRAELAAAASSTSENAVTASELQVLTTSSDLAAKQLDTKLATAASTAVSRTTQKQLEVKAMPATSPAASHIAPKQSGVNPMISAFAAVSGTTATTSHSITAQEAMSTAAVEGKVKLKVTGVASTAASKTTLEHSELKGTGALSTASSGTAMAQSGWMAGAASADTTAKQSVSNPTAAGKPVSTRYTLRDAESELRRVWKKLSAEEHEEWAKRARQYESTLDKEGELTYKKPAALQPISKATKESGSSGTETGIVTPANSDEDAEPETVKPAMVPVSCETSLASKSSQVLESEQETAPVVMRSAALASIDHTGNEVKPVSPSPPLEPSIDDDGSAVSEKTGIVLDKAPPSGTAPAKRKRSPSSCPPRRITPSFHWRLKPEHIDLCYEAALDHYHKVMHTVKARGLYSELADGFDLLRERGRGRYDMELPVFDTPAFDFLTDLRKASWMPVVREILGEDVILIHKGAFLSMPGAETQVYHQDGPHLTTKYQRPCHAINVFVPLVDLHSRNGPTEFCLGTHILGHEGFVKERVETPRVPAGTPVIFDYRLGHRGLGNSSSTCRPIVYCTYAAAANGKEFRDSVNFSRKRYHKIGDLLSLPPSREERARKRNRLEKEKEEHGCNEATT